MGQSSLSLPAWSEPLQISLNLERCLVGAIQPNLELDLMFSQFKLSSNLLGMGNIFLAKFILVSKLKKFIFDLKFI